MLSTLPGALSAAGHRRPLARAAAARGAEAEEVPARARPQAQDTARQLQPAAAAQRHHEGQPARQLLGQATT